MEQDYDIKYLLRQLALTDVYQRSSQQAREDTDGASVDVYDFSVALLKPLSPEQLAWSMMQATGVAEQQLKLLIANQEKKKDEQDTSEPIWQEKSLNRALRKNVAAFTGLFGNEGVQQARFDASADQALFLRNGDLLQRWVALKDGLADRLVVMLDNEVAEEFYVSVFSRMPTAEEVNMIEALLEKSEDRKTDIRQLVWAGLASAEFRFNH